jgi:hypothetical protein
MLFKSKSLFATTGWRNYKQILPSHNIRANCLYNYTQNITILNLDQSEVTYKKYIEPCFL